MVYDSSYREAEKTGFLFIQDQDKYQGLEMIYSRYILKDIILKLNESLFDGDNWALQQDSAPAHIAKTTLK